MENKRFCWSCGKDFTSEPDTQCDDPQCDDATIVNVKRPNTLVQYCGKKGPGKVGDDFCTDAVEKRFRENLATKQSTF